MQGTQDSGKEPVKSLLRGKSVSKQVIGFTCHHLDGSNETKVTWMGCGRTHTGQPHGRAEHPDLAVVQRQRLSSFLFLKGIISQVQSIFSK